MKRPPVFLQSGGSCLSTIDLTISLSLAVAIVGQAKYTRACAKFRGNATRRERLLEISRAPQLPSPKLETTCSLINVLIFASSNLTCDILHGLQFNSMVQYVTYFTVRRRTLRYDDVRSGSGAYLTVPSRTVSYRSETHRPTLNRVEFAAAAAFWNH